jgi:predicted ATPase
LSVFAGGWTLEAAERVCTPDDGSGWEVLDVLTRLVDKSMVVADSSASGVDRYRLLETLRQYGEERLAESREAKLMRQRHFEYFLALATAAHTQAAVPRLRERWLTRLDNDNDNLRTALASSSIHRRAAARQFGVDLSWHWQNRRRHMEAITWQESLLDATPSIRCFRRVRLRTSVCSPASATTWIVRRLRQPRRNYISMHLATFAVKRTS